MNGTGKMKRYPLACLSSGGKNAYEAQGYKNDLFQ
jgi:hypothetical protein